MGASINDDVRDIVRELDADGSGFRTREAANLLVHRYEAAGICDGEGRATPKVRTLMRMGASTAIHGYREGAATDHRTRERATASAEWQRDFQEVADGFDHEWLRSYAAMDESDDAERKMLVRMTRDEVLAVIALKRKKAAEAFAVAGRLQRIVDENPDWADSPSLTVADILGITD